MSNGGSWADDENLGASDAAELSARLQGSLKLSEQEKEQEKPDTHLVTRNVGLVESTEAPVVDSDSPLRSATTFPELGLSEQLLKGVFSMNYNAPSRIQGLAIPAILRNPPQHFIGQAQSGTGKTAAFSLSMLTRVDPTRHTPQALCLAPTRELSRQIYDVVTKLAQFTDIKVLLVVPEADVPKNITQQILIGTPGKVTSLLTTNKKVTQDLVIFVLDEADEMLNIQGLQNQSLKIHKKLPPRCQICLFSATYNDSVAAFADKIVPNPKTKIYIPPEKLTLDKLAQFSIDCGNEENKFKVLDEIYGYVNVGQSIIFVQTRATAKKLTDYMITHKHEVSLLHGNDMAVQERDRVIDSFRAGKTRVLITTNVLARGVDVLQVSLVINFDIPLDQSGRPDPETYLHRIGRSARFGNSGVAINFVHDDKSKADLQYISSHFQKVIEPLPVDQLEKVGEMLDKIA